MIDAVLGETCIVKERLDDTRNRNNEYQYSNHEDVPCKVINEFGKVSKVVDEKYVNISKTVLITRLITENDLIVLKDGFEYRVVTGMNAVGIEPIQDFMTDAIEGYQISLIRERKEDEYTPAIKEASDRKGLATG